MELRKDPITRSWVITGDNEQLEGDSRQCVYCLEHDGQRSGPSHALHVPAPILSIPSNGAPGGIRVYPHPFPMYSIEGGADRRAEGIYDQMRNLGAHEVMIESSDHYHELSLAPDAEIAALLRCWALRISDLKNDIRLRYITVFKNRGVLSGQQVRHAHSELVASAFIPRRVLYELRSCKDYYQLKERCVFCDIQHQEERQGKRVVDVTPRYLAICPFASRVPYEIWILPRRHHSSFEEDLLARPEDFELASLMRRILARLEHVAQSYHMVLHTSPNTRAKPETSDYWSTLADDYHWHIEIMPITERRSKSYSLKETYYCPLLPEQAAARLRDLPTSFAGRLQSQFKFAPEQ